MRLQASLLAAVVAAAAVSPVSREGAHARESGVDEARIHATGRLWEYERDEFRGLVRLPAADIGRFQRLLHAARAGERQRDLALLLALNCGLPARWREQAEVQQYRCGTLAYPALERWAKSPSGDIYVLAFAKPADRPTAIAALRVEYQRLASEPIERVSDKELILELIGFLEAGGLP